MFRWSLPIKSALLYGPDIVVFAKIQKYYYKIYIGNSTTVQRLNRIQSKIKWFIQRITLSAPSVHPQNSMEWCHINIRKICKISSGTHSSKILYFQGYPFINVKVSCIQQFIHSASRLIRFQREVLKGSR